ncbi:substrate-binding periplasmic protein [Litorilituus lipolyticus]|uniref:Transporter substrate-binding domain-containing protein n=1 Tax=Litorilituus lipolyticus TaxID=2491017 RepID=A0A502KQJ1_9GAMM|nr:transporter substrate-binding domain-containing protein [Litorilituus lipolyticus]TPH14020.1 transporter substrate-binding domain-containing protein [Litorilituus lipolyticus]
MEINQQQLWLCFVFLIQSAVLQAKKIEDVVILADDSYPPYSYIENGQLKGIYVDFIHEASKLIADKYKVSIIAVPWKRALQEIKEGQALAIIPPYQHLKDRSYIWPYSKALMKERVVAFCYSDINLMEYLNMKHTNEERPLIIGINAGYMILSQELVNAINKGIVAISENKSTLSNVLKLHSRRIDCYINDRVSTLWEFSRLSLKKQISFDNIRESMVVMSQTAHIGYTNSEFHNFTYKDDFVERMDNALSQLFTSNEFQLIINRYLLETDE